MTENEFDVLVIGAGPSGAVASAMLVQRGWKVLVIEKEYFPRFSIGESLLPQCMEYIEQAGLLPVLTENAQALGFQFKNGAAFHHAGKDSHFDFTEKFSPGHGTTYQVKRDVFDKLLADGAAEQGVEIRYGHQVTAMVTETDGVALTVLDPAKKSYQVRGKYVLDASGFGRVLPRLLNLERPSTFPVRQAYFTHINDNISDLSFDRNKILITVHPHHPDIWYWLIPFSDGSASIGVVGKPEQFSQYSASSDQEVLFDFINQDPNLRELLKSATPKEDTRSIKGYSANVTTLHGERFALLGNAGEFLDPVFSSGVTIALKSAALIAPLLDKYLKNEAVDFELEYSDPLKLGVNCFKTFVTAWYDTRFQHVVFHQGQADDSVTKMISSILAGYAWDTKNPYVAQSERRLNVLAELCADHA
ncbi:MAG: NAD(P)/FAD-dependent oxidoreductase [Gammaproteobacteria bacterium]|nr:NAD(P)/FAD-dependent oxidoreductase [Gammaproteobacteria bacterium]